MTTPYEAYNRGAHTLAKSLGLSPGSFCFGSFRAGTLDEFITAVSKAFPGAIDGVAISAKGIGVLATDDRMLRRLVRVKPGVTLTKQQVKEIRTKSGVTMRYKGEN